MTMMFMNEAQTPSTLETMWWKIQKDILEYLINTNKDNHYLGIFLETWRIRITNQLQGIKKIQGPARP